MSSCSSAPELSEPRVAAMRADSIACSETKGRYRGDIVGRSIHCLLSIYRREGGQRRLGAQGLCGLRWLGGFGAHHGGGVRWCAFELGAERLGGWEELG